MTRVYVSIGSNIDKEKNIASCIACLRERYLDLQLSTIYENEAMGFEGENFYNLVAGFDTREDIATLAREMREIEYEHGRSRGGQRFSSRTLDIDLLLYDDLVIDQDGLQLPRDEITKYAFVLKPLAEIAGQCIHPVLGKSFEALWSDYLLHHDAPEMWKVELAS